MATVYLAHDPRHERRVALKVLRPEMSRRAGAASGSPARSRSPRGSTTRTSCRCATRARSTRAGGTPVALLHHALRRAAARFATGCARSPSCRSRGGRRWPGRSRRRWTTPTPRAWCTATSSRRTSCWPTGRRPGRRLRHRPGARCGRRRAAHHRPAWSLGTPAYMSPEQGLGAARSTGAPTSTRWAACSTRCSPGRRPSPGSTSQAILARHAAGPVPPLATVRPMSAPGLERVVLRALAKVPADRFPSAAAFEAALADLG